MPNHDIDLLKVAMHPINFCTSWMLSGGFILVIADTFSGLGSIPRWETINPSDFPEGTPNVHFLVFSFILNFLELSKVSTRYEMCPSSLSPCRKCTLQRCAQVVNADTVVYPAGRLHPCFLIRRE
jgi:hypothetical protein